MQKLIVLLAGLSFIALSSAVSLAQAPTDVVQQDVTAGEEMEKAAKETVNPEGEPAAKSDVVTSGKEDKEERKARKQIRKRGLDRADEAAEEHGKHGREKARAKGKR